MVSSSTLRTSKIEKKKTNKQKKKGNKQEQKINRSEDGP